MNKILAAAGLMLVLFFSCTNGPGQGGKAMIQGRLHATNVWNSNCLAITGGDQYFAPDEDVYIIYGDDPSYGDRTKTSPDGTFWFRYLRPGKYTVYVYSNDCTEPSGKKAVEIPVEITEKKQETDLGTIEIEK